MRCSLVVLISGLVLAFGVACGDPGKKTNPDDDVAAVDLSSGDTPADAPADTLAEVPGADAAVPQVQMVAVPAGPFWMGCDGVRDTQCENNGLGGCETLPAEQQVDCAAHQRLNPWGDMQATCEVAVMSETGLQADGGCGAAWPLPVSSKPAGASPYGVLDAVGNVGEWVEDCMEASYEGAPTDGSARTSCTWPVGDWLSGQYRGHRGSDWMKPQWFQRGAQRGADPPTGTLTVVGIRCCRS